MLEKVACEFSNRVVTSLKSGAAIEEISAHLRDCTDCRETARVVSFFQSNLKNEFAPLSLPSAGLIWWKSRLREKQHRAELIQRPMFIVQIVAAISFGSVLVWLFSSGWLATLALGRLFDSIEKIFVPMFAGTVGFLLICFILIFTLRRYLLEK